MPRFVPQGHDRQTRLVLGLLALCEGLSFIINDNNWALPGQITYDNIFHFPLPIIGVILLVGSALILLTNHTLRFVGYLIGAVIYSSLGMIILWNFVNSVVAGELRASPAILATNLAVAAWYWIAAYRSAEKIGEHDG